VTLGEWVTLAAPPLHVKYTAISPDVTSLVAGSDFTKPDMPEPSAYRSPLLPDCASTSPVAWQTLARFLAGHPSEDFVEFVVSGFRSGFHLLVDMPEAAMGFTRANLASATAFPQHVEKYVRKELLAGRFLGPFRLQPAEVHPQLVVNPWGSVPKVGLEEEVLRRVITHLSAGPEPGQFAGSVNSFTVAGLTVEFPTRGDAVAIAVRYFAGGDDVWLLKTDLVGAFRVCPLHPGFYHLLGFLWEGDLMVDTRLGFGSSSGPFIFQCFGNAIRYIVNRAVLEEVGEDKGSVLNLLDDFIGVCRGRDVADVVFRTLMDVLAAIGAETAEHKTCEPNQDMEVLGMRMITEGGVGICLPMGKLRDYVRRCASVRDCRASTKGELLTLAGKLTFAAEAHPRQVAFSSELFLRAHAGGPNPAHFVRPSNTLRAHMQRWITAMEGSPMRWMHVSPPQVNQLDVVGDASGTIGYGAFEARRGQCFFTAWPEGMVAAVTEGNEQDSSTLREIICMLVAVQTWTPERGHAMGYSTDNQGVVAAIARGRSRVRSINNAIIAIGDCAEQAGGFVRCRWQRRSQPHQIAADHLSRLDLPAFAQVAEESGWSPTPGFSVLPASPASWTGLLWR